MEKMRKIASIIISMMLISAFALSSCSESGNANTVPFSETVKGEGVRIWYECQNKIEEKEDEDPYGLNSLLQEGEDDAATPTEYGRETRVVWIRVYKNGKLSSYSTLKNVYLGYFAKMTDEEIIKVLDSDKETFLCGQKDQPFDIYLYSDATGHEIRFEGVPHIIQLGKKKDPMYFMTLIGDETIPIFQVYDSYYGGYVLYNYDETPFGEACLITRCEEGAAFGLDSLDLEGAIVDYATPEDMLREKNEALEKERKKTKINQVVSEESEEGLDGSVGETDDSAEGGY